MHSLTMSERWRSMIGPQVHPKVGSEVAPRLIAANSIMQLATVELEQAIMRELDENPALELVERSECPVCGGPLQFGSCPHCNGLQFGALEPQASSSDSSPMSYHALSADESDFIWTVPAPITLNEHLMAQLRLILDESEHVLASYVVGNLDEHGYFSSSIEDLTQALHLDAARIQAVLQELHQLDPAGIGARNLTECLLIQLRRLTAQGIVPPSATEAIIRDHLADLGHHRFDHIRSVLKTSREAVEEAFLFIRANLHPYPAHHYDAQANTLPSGASPIPSIVIRESPNEACGYEVEVVESQRFLLQVNPLYRQIHHQPHTALSPRELEHVSHFLDRARLFIQHLRRRYRLLHKLATYLVNHQRDFLRYGPLYLYPLTQSAIAREFKIHVSTISRAVAGKFVLLPSRQIVPLSLFFAAEQRMQELIRQLIAHEDQPLSDEHIARLLQKGHNVTLSRQMVANHRMALGIPAARQRAVLRRGQKKVPGHVDALEVARKEERNPSPRL